MFLELLIAGHFQTYRPAPEPVKEETAVTQIVEVAEEPAPPEKEEPTEPSLEEKIATNFYKCDEATHYIRADNAKCLPKPINTRPTTQTRPTAPVRASQGKPASGWYPWGQCTWYVWTKRSVGFWNNASDWLWQAKRDGWATGSVPRVGAIAWQYGHVALVTAISGNNVTISESNYKGLGVISSRTVPASTFQYIY